MGTDLLGGWVGPGDNLEKLAKRKIIDPE